jgi:hypothetical protein
MRRALRLIVSSRPISCGPRSGIEVRRPPSPYPLQPVKMDPLDPAEAWRAEFLAEKETLEWRGSSG